jgi:serine/threonine protein kinase
MDRAREPIEASAIDTDARPVLEHRYVLLEELGRGGFSVVNMAWDLVLRKIVAIKQMRPEFAAQELLRNEAVVAMDLAHDGIVRMYHFEPGRAGSGPYLVMEYLAWPTGEKWLARAGQSGLPPSVVLEIGLQACHALAYAHDRGVLHLDLKPGNFFVDPAAERIKLADFGLSRSLEHARRALMTHPAGTPAYMAPEQAQAGNRVSAATDVFLLAATLWDMLAGAPPHAHGSDPQRAVRPGLRKEVLECLVPALARTPGDRPRDARAFTELVRSALAVC